MQAPFLLASSQFVSSLARRLSVTSHLQPGLLRALSAATSVSDRSPFACASEEVMEALTNGRPVVALESTILTHGLPADRALRLGVDVEAVVRENGAVPATVAVVNRRLRVGLSRSELEHLIDAARQGNARKAAIRDLPFALTCSDRSVVFGTTVSATSFAAHLFGVRVFATGGIGGVHRGAEVTMDVSSDLLTLNSIPVAVVSAGVKSILDIPKTLEVLESKGVTVASVGTDIFPAFFTRNSGVKSPGRIDSPEEAGRLFATSLTVRPSAGMLFAVPIPENLQAVGETIAKATEKAQKEADQMGITGAAVTPFMLERVRQLTDDASLTANVHLVLNNAKFAAQLAVNLIGYMNTPSGSVGPNETPQIVVVGGSNEDMTIKLLSKEIKNTKDINPPASYAGTVETLGGGGVGRNVAEAVARLSSSHMFLTAVSGDSAGRRLFGGHTPISWKTAPVSQSQRTAKYVGVLNSTGELLFGVADMDIHQQVTPAFVENELHKVVPSQLKVVCSDGNVTRGTLIKLISFAAFHAIPFWYEPTDLHKCTKIVDAVTPDRPIDAVSPNLTELASIYQRVTGKQLQVDATSRESLMACAFKMRRSLSSLCTNWIVKLGRHGVLYVSAVEACHYTSPIRNQNCIVSVSGAGDTSVGAILYLRYIKKWPWKRAVLGGLRAAELSLASKNPVPNTLKADIFEEDDFTIWTEKITIDNFNV